MNFDFLRFLKLATYIGAVALPHSVYAKTSTYTIATGGTMGVYYPVGGSICRLLNVSTKDNSVKCTVHSTSGSSYNIKAILNGEDDFAIVQSDKLHQAYNKDKQTNIREIFPLYQEDMAIVVNGNINSLADLNGKKVNFGAKDSGNYNFAKSFFTLFPEIKIKTTEYDYPAIESKFCNKDVDATIFVGGSPNWIVGNFIEKCGGKVLSLSQKEIETVTSKYSYVIKHEIPAEYYYSTDQAMQPVTTVAMQAVLIASDKMDVKTVKTLINVLSKNLESFKGSHPLLRTFELDSTNQATIPVHEGVKK